MRYKTYTKAAEVSGVSKSHVSKAISRLERKLGGQLFERNPRRVTPTLFAEELQRQVDDSIHSISRALHDLRSSQSMPKGRLRITTAGEYGERVIAQKSVAFIKQYPEVEIDLVFSNSVLDLAENRIDIAIRNGALPDSDLIARQIDSRRITTVCSPLYARANSKPGTPLELKQHECLVGSSDEWVFESDGVLKPVKIWGKWKSNNGSALAMAARSGLGIAQLPETYTRRYLEDGTLLECLTEHQTHKQPIWAVFQKRSANSLLIRKYVESLMHSTELPSIVCDLDSQS